MSGNYSSSYGLSSPRKRAVKKGSSSGASSSGSESSLDEQRRAVLAKITSRLRSNTVDDTKYDRRVAFRCWLMLALAFSGIILMMISLELAFVGVGTALQPNNTTEILKIFISITTFFLLVTIIEYYHFIHHIQTEMLGINTHVSMWSTPLRWPLIAELIVNAYHLVPYLMINTNSYIDDKMGCFMLIRFYHIIRVIRNNTRVYQDRFLVRTIAKNDAVHSMKFGASLTLKAHFLERPGTFILTISFVMYFTAVYLIYITERQVQADFGGGVVFYFSIITMTTVGYGDFSPKTNWGRFTASIMAMWGIVSTSLIVAVTAAALNLKPHQKYVTELSAIAKIEKHEATAAAKYIQFHWRQREKVKKLKREGKVAKEDIQALEAQNLARNMELMKLLRKYRRERLHEEANMNDPIIPKLEELEYRMSTLEDMQKAQARKTEAQTILYTRLEEKIDRLLEIME